MIILSNKIRIFSLIFLFVNLSVGGYAQEYQPDKSKIGFTAGLLSYTGRYSVDNDLMDHTSWGASFFYVPNIHTVKNLDFKIELMGGHLKADNTALENPVTEGSFSTNILELSVRGEYNFIDLNKKKFTPYISAGPGVYRLLNYESSNGEKESSEMTGFVLPVGGGIKYKVAPRLLLLADGNVRFFGSNLDNVPDAQNENNPNKYVNVSLGISYKIGKQNVLW